MTITTTRDTPTTTPTVAPLNLVRLELIESKVLSYVSRRCRQAPEDLRYTVHMALKGLDIESFIRPFQIQKPRGGVIPILAYGPPAKRIHDYLTLSTDVDAERLAMIDLPTLLSKPMSFEFGIGEVFKFSVEVVPTTRFKKENGKWGEKDALLIERETSPETTREAAYLKWLTSNDGKLKGAEVLDLQYKDWHCPENFLRAQPEHGSSERRINRPKLPNCTLTGLLRITDPAQFLKTCSLGVGAHHGWRGFGMLKLLPCM